MKKLKDMIARDFWVVFLDLIAVSASYYLALLVRFYVNFQMRPIVVQRYLPAWLGFLPWYAVLSIVVFMCFRLYGGLWRYAGINDMNRIVLANIVTMIIHIVGTLAFFTRMPISYYVIGALLQLAFIVMIRFANRALLVEKKRILFRKEDRIPALIVGSGENGRRVVKHLEDGDLFRPVAVVGSGSGTMDGVPVITMDAIDWKAIQAVFIADPLLSSGQRMIIKEQAEKAGIEVSDYTGFFTNLGGRLPVTELLATIHSSVKIVLNGVETEYPDGTAALSVLTEKYTVKDIDGDLRITLEKQKELSVQEALAQAYAAVTGDGEPQ